MGRHELISVLFALLAALAVVALLGWARGEPGDDGRVPDADDRSAAVAPSG